MEQFIQDNAKIIRHILGYTQGEMADLLGVSRAHLGAVEGGRTEAGRTFSLAFIMVIWHASKEVLDEGSIECELMDIYLKKIDDFRENIFILE
jgi:DNA-binding XRE family transcriptional regulator